MQALTVYDLWEKNYPFLATFGYMFATDGVVRRMVWRHVVLMVTGVGLLVARWVVMGSTVPRFMKVDNPASFLDSVLFRVSSHTAAHSGMHDRDVCVDIFL